MRSVESHARLSHHYSSQSWYDIVKAQAQSSPLLAYHTLRQWRQAKSSRSVPLAAHSIVFSSLAKQGNYLLMKQLLDDMMAHGPKPNIIAYNTMLDCLRRSCKYDEMIECVQVLCSEPLFVDTKPLSCRFFARLRSDGQTPTSVTYTMMLQPWICKHMWNDITGILNNAVRQKHNQTEARESLLCAHLTATA